MKRINRREVNKTLALTLFGSEVALQTALAAPTQAMKILELSQVDANFKHFNFTFENTSCVLQRVAVPKENSPRVLLVEQQAFVALSRRCTHAGCATATEEDGTHFCDCHGSIFNAIGGVISGPARVPLLAVKLEVREKNIWAIDFLR